MRVKFEDEETVEVQMAPLIDCVFLLLIFFLVGTTLKKINKELPLDLPQAAAAVSKQVVDDMTIVSIDREGNFYLDSNLVGQGFLAKKLHELAAQDPAHRIRIDADRDAPMWSAVQILDICNFENLKNVGIRTKQVTEPNYRAQ
jgi:biopolymer transport protein ExbD